MACCSLVMGALSIATQTLISIAVAVHCGGSVGSRIGRFGWALRLGMTLTILRERADGPAHDAAEGRAACAGRARVVASHDRRLAFDRWAGWRSRRPR